MDKPFNTAKWSSPSAFIAYAREEDKKGLGFDLPFLENFFTENPQLSGEEVRVRYQWKDDNRVLMVKPKRGATVNYYHRRFLENNHRTFITIPEDEAKKNRPPRSGWIH